jgi:hypothetical protein
MDALMLLLLPLLTGIGSSLWAWCAGWREPGRPRAACPRGPIRSGDPHAVCECHVLPGGPGAAQGAAR